MGVSGEGHAMDCCAVVSFGRKIRPKRRSRRKEDFLLQPPASKESASNLGNSISDGSAPEDLVGDGRGGRSP